MARTMRSTLDNSTAPDVLLSSVMTDEDSAIRATTPALSAIDADEKVGQATRGVWSARLGPVIAGLLVIVVGYSGPVLIIRQAVENAGLSARVADSWIFTVSAGAGLAGFTLSWWLRQPIIVAFNTAGTVLLTTSLKDYRYSDAVTAYLIVGVACVIIGLTGSFTRLLRLIPAPIVSAMLAGVLFKFGTGYFASLPGAPEARSITAMVAAMGVVYFVARSRGSRLAVVWTSAVGVVCAVALGTMTSQGLDLSIAHPLFTSPTVHGGAIIGLALPLLALALSSQYATGYAMLRGHGYDPNMDRVLMVTGGIGAALAPLGCPGLNLAAITAGLATGPEAHFDPAKRYQAGLWTGVFNIAIGLLGVSALTVFAVMPREFVAAVTGLALFGAIVSAASAALAEPQYRDAAGATLLCAAAGFSLFHIGAPFWALVVGLGVSALSRTKSS
jgi:benzoate membrane transport protein